MWKIKKIVSKGDYNYAIVDGHPFATKNNYVLEHRIVMENYLGRLLNPDEIVHHKDGDKKNNIIENLELMTNSEHAILHQTIGRSMVLCKCPYCKKLFTKEKKNSHLIIKNKKLDFCSSSCSGKFYTSEFHRKTAIMKKAVSENIVSEYNSHDNPEQTN